MRANELELLRANGVEPCLLMDNGGKTGRLPFGEAALALRPRVNLFPNWYFADPVNQRGLMEYGAGYSTDRWILQSMTNGKLALHSGYTTVFSTHNDGVCVYIKESDCFLGETYTMSVLTYDNQLYTHTFTLLKIGAIYNYPDTEWSAYAGYKNGMYLFYPIIAYNKAEQISIDVVAVKLEHSPHQTLAHKEGDTWVLNDPPPNKTLELLKCQRYMYVLDAKPGTAISTGVSDSNGALAFPITVPVEMRCVPAVSFTGTFRTHGQGHIEYAPVSSFAGTGMQSHIVNLVLGGLQPYTTYTLDAYPSGKLIFDSNL